MVLDDGTEGSHYGTRVLVPDFMEQWNSMELSLSRDSLGLHRRINVGVLGTIETQRQT